MKASLIDRAALKGAGYREFPPHTILRKLVDGAFQRRVLDGRITLYFINAFVYEPHGEHGGGAEVEVRLYHDGAGDGGFDLTLPWAGEIGIEKTEAFIARAYSALGCVPDRHNNDSEVPA